MKLPKRTPEHVKESASWQILQAKIPAMWILRETTERDYGIDAYLELCTHKGEVTGDLCLLQLKGTEAIQWAVKQKGDHAQATFSGTKMATVNYWMRLPVPVFLLLADLRENRLFFAPAKEQVRSQYKKFLKQETLSFDFSMSLEFGDKLGEVAFLAYYLREKHRARFRDSLLALLTHWREYLEFIRENQGRDCFLDVEEDRVLMLEHIYNMCRFLSQFLAVEWTVPDLHDAYTKDRETWKDPHAILHEATLEKILVALEPVYLEILREARDRVAGDQGEYWLYTNRVLYNMCANLRDDELRAVW